MKKAKNRKKTTRSKIVKSNNSAHLNYITIKRTARTTEEERKTERERKNEAETEMRDRE